MKTIEKPKMTCLQLIILYDFHNISACIRIDLMRRVRINHNFNSLCLFFLIPLSHISIRCLDFFNPIMPCL